MQTRERRVVQRIHFDRPLRASVANGYVSIIDLSVSGARVQHDFALTSGKQIRLDFEWNSRRVTRLIALEGWNRVTVRAPGTDPGSRSAQGPAALSTMRACTTTGSRMRTAWNRISAAKMGVEISPMPGINPMIASTRTHSSAFSPACTATAFFWLASMHRGAAYVAAACFLLYRSFRRSGWL